MKKQTEDLIWLGGALFLVSYIMSDKETFFQMINRKLNEDIIKMNQDGTYIGIGESQYVIHDQGTAITPEDIENSLAMQRNTFNHVINSYDYDNYEDDVITSLGG